MSSVKRLAIFASGSGTNAEKIMHYFAEQNNIEVACVITNKKNAGVLERASKASVPSIRFPKADFDQPTALIEYLKSKEVDFIILAGFLLKISPQLISAYPDRIINIHPALLPKYGGKGMYGHFVHEAVIDNMEKESGITIHLVNENYDEGRIIFQAKCEVSPEMNPDQLAAKVQQLEHQHFPKVIEEYVNKFEKAS
ncbi:phosphoribosylglycinamide formyltransferase [Marivirga arenosa]|uniref:Phosphoribosylglycinamide formyltransferase n=1 Tax=Marivirga arenosa TaxID=3059076 RepID=A0AA49JDB9_9BACT|nr:phosphoribosylglycinamide formyltransferase [Marivirga sp. BKB1-2]WKK82752.1 phosphoribosylglycinamide formyltransferase [Marivirga sp. BKB1-2]